MSGINYSNNSNSQIIEKLDQIIAKLEEMEKGE